MIHFILIVYATYLILDMLSENEESLAMAYVGPTEFNKNKNLMSKQEFKKYVWDNVAKMRKAQDDAAKQWRNK